MFQKLTGKCKSVRNSNNSFSEYDLPDGTLRKAAIAYFFHGIGDLYAVDLCSEKQTLSQLVDGKLTDFRGNDDILFRSRIACDTDSFS